MRIITKQPEEHILSIVSAVSKDKDSWKDWSCLRVTLDSENATNTWFGLYASIKRVLEIYLSGKQGTIFMCGHEEIHVFCKDVPEALLEKLGQQIVYLIVHGTNINAEHKVFDLQKDSDLFLNTYNGTPLPVKETQGTETQEAFSFLLPMPQDGKSDALSQINSRKVLLVDDDPVTRWMVKIALKDNCRLAVAPDAHKALIAYDANKPDIVLLDINLPGKSGHDVMARIIKSDPGAHIVMFSSYDSLENITATLESGAKAFIAKPFNKERLLQCVHSSPSGR